MTHLGFIGRELVDYLLIITAGLVAGALIGIFHFLTLRWNSQLFVSGHWLLPPLGIQLIRFALIAFALTVVAKIFGAVLLLVTAAGILVARTAIIHRIMPS